MSVMNTGIASDDPADVTKLLMEIQLKHNPSSIKELMDLLPNSTYHEVSRYQLIVTASKLIRSGKICHLMDKKVADAKEYKKEYRRSK